MNISSTFLSSLLGGFGVALLLHPPKSDDKNVEEMFTKCSTAQSFIRTEMTTYRIGTLVPQKNPYQIFKFPQISASRAASVLAQSSLKIYFFFLLQSQSMNSKVFINLI